MSTFEDLSFHFETFSGEVRLFPLPNLVMFPHVMQPLHIFEPRYREMLEDAISDDKLLAMAVLAPGWESDYDGRPPIFPFACLGRVATSHRLSDGTYNLLLLGLRRVRLLGELESSKSYRKAVVEICEDECPPKEAAARATLQRELRTAFMHLLPTLPDAHEQVDQLLGGDIPLGVLTDIISYMLDIDIAEKEALLAERDVYHRAELLLEHLSLAATDATAAAAGGFPPKFSIN